MAQQNLLKSDANEAIKKYWHYLNSLNGIPEAFGSLHVKKDLDRFKKYLQNIGSDTVKKFPGEFDSFVEPWQLEALQILSEAKDAKGFYAALPLKHRSDDFAQVFIKYIGSIYLQMQIAEFNLLPNLSALLIRSGISEKQASEIVVNFQNELWLYGKQKGEKGEIISEGKMKALRELAQETSLEGIFKIVANNKHEGGFHLREYDTFGTILKGLHDSIANAPRTEVVAKDAKQLKQ